MAISLEQAVIDVPTATGESVKSTELGFTLMHEHTFSLSPEINLNYPETWGDEEERVAEAIGQYRELKAAGVDTIVDVTVLGLGRYIPRVKRIAEAVDLNIIVATGIYIWNSLPMYFSILGPGNMWGGPETMHEMFIRDIESGIGDTGVRAGIIKLPTDIPGLTPDVERVLRAGAVAHRKTGVPITTHTKVAPNGLDQQRIFAEEGVDLSRVIIGHVNRAAAKDLSYVQELIDMGSTVGFDYFRPNFLPSDDVDREIDAVAALCARGHSDQIVLSHDHACFCDFAPPGLMDKYGKTFVIDTVIPELRKRGVPDDDIDQMTRRNPQKLFETTGSGPY
jgi:phosphotriesterase-related protein